ncbi:Hydrolase, alpha/beta fold family [uncultured Rubrobacteraceae bacterium]|uniref:Hydrolase, alpha/beta fold family n=1 Tax=uncultured Rubrobacteraceae bacterium TaxID=349277 RepID=A0A6J4QF54_9ACTN|nr:Hydrolase, alpha/beta fold family [uncultured Rubrobacteraceae bacterium]
MEGSGVEEEVRESRLDGGVIRYRDVGTGPVLFFVHGILVNGTLWRHVVARLSGRFRCIVPDLPLGGHSVAMESGADMSPPGVARMVDDLMREVDLRDVTLVGNDTGGAICQIVISNHPGRIGGLVLTNCDAYEAFFPAPLSPFHYLARLFGARFVDVLAWALRARFAQRVLFKTVALRHVEDATLDANMTSFIRDPGVRRDLARFLGSISNRYTLEAARSFPGFDRPVLIAWGLEDLFFSPRLALRLQHDFPDARLEAVPGSRAFVPEDRPEQLARLIEELATQTVARDSDGLREEVLSED